MTIEQIRNNLRTTIENKERYLSEIRASLKNKSDADAAVLECVAHTLVINIDELRRILKDIEECISENQHT